MASVLGNGTIVPNVSKDTKPGIGDIYHPEHSRKKYFWQKWRLVYEGGQRFINQYLSKFSSRESDKDFLLREKITYNPAFATAAVNEVQRSIYQRTTDITRVGGSSTYQQACEGLINGVDLLGRDMNAFIGTQVLPELLSMAKVGIYVDMPPLRGDETKAELADRKARPYVYIFRAEEIQSWKDDEGNNPNEYEKVLLRECNWECDDEYGLPSNVSETYRYIYLRVNEEGKRKVYVQRFNSKSESLGPEIELNIDKIPFVCLEISDSLLAEAANYQIALLNLASSDVAYCLTANFPFYTEQFDPKTEGTFIKQPDDFASDETNFWTHETSTENTKEVRVGAAVGRQYPTGSERPAFIFPSPEPMKASMEKQRELKDDIRLLVGLSLSNIKPKMASAESKAVDVEGLEAGLSYIGLVLQHAERKIAEFWAMYEGKGTPAVVNYPERYSLQSSSDIREEVTQLLLSLEVSGSPTLRKFICKRIANVLIGRHVKKQDMQTIFKEIDDAKSILPTFDTVIAAITAGFLSLEAAAAAYGFDPSIVTDAADEHAARLDRIAKAQTPPDAAARGVRDLGSDPNAGKTERKAANDQTKAKEPQDPTRGKGK